MIPLPPNTTVNYNIRIVISELTSEMKEWWVLVGGIIEEVTSSRTRYRSIPTVTEVLSMNGAKNSHKMQDGTNSFILTFNGTDACIASMFILKFSNYVTAHNMKEYETYVY